MANRVAFLLIVSFLMLSGGISANDGSVALTPEGLQFVKTGNISIEEEELYISIRQIKVKYVFYNNSDKDFETYVAFPLPETGPYVDPRKHFFDDFTVFVNGKKVKYEKEVKTEKIESDEYWGFQKRYYWKQNFPAKKKLNVIHSYRPQEGMSQGTSQDEYKYVYNVGYILKTAKLWKGPIKKFMLAIEKDPNDRIEFVLNGKKINIEKGKTRYQTVLPNFIPSNDIDLKWYSNINFRELIDSKKAQP